MNLFAETDYRQAILALTERRQALERGFTRARVARDAGLQSSYLSNVLSGRANLNADQLFRIAQSFGLKEEETDYLLLLLEADRCQIPQRRAVLDERIRAVRHAHLKTSAHVSAKKIAADDLSVTEYYLDPYVMIVHVFLGIPRYAKDVSRIAEALGFGMGKLRRVLGTLERLGYAERARDGHYKLVQSHRHLPEDSPLCLPHQILFRLKSADRLPRLAPAQRYAFSVTFSASEEVYDKIRADFLSYVKKCEASVKSVKHPDRVYQLNYDLFSWDAEEA